MSRVPQLPPSFPRRGNRFTHALGHALLAAWGWRMEGEFPDRPKVLAIVAPHTSNWDFPLGIATVYALGLHVRFLAKPAGTRSASLNWKSGFYHIASAARIPIIPIAFDAERRVIRLFPAVEASGDYAADLPRLLRPFEGIRGLRS